MTFLLRRRRGNRGGNGKYALKIFVELGCILGMFWFVRKGGGRGALTVYVVSIDKHSAISGAIKQ